MPKRGPAQKPTALKILEGNPGKRPLPQDEPQPSIDISVPACPAYLKGIARQEWGRIAPELHRLGLLTLVDHAALEAYCSAYAQFVEADKELARIRRSSKDIQKNHRKDQNIRLISNGLVSITASGNAIMEPLLSVRKQAMETMHKFLSEFGMTPASRARISVNSPLGKGKTKSSMQGLLAATIPIVGKN